MKISGLKSPIKNVSEIKILLKRKTSPNKLRTNSVIQISEKLLQHHESHNDFDKGIKVLTSYQLIKDLIYLEEGIVFKVIKGDIANLEKMTLNMI